MIRASTSSKPRRFFVLAVLLLSAVGLAAYLVFGADGLKRLVSPLDHPPVPELLLGDVEPRVVSALTTAREALVADPDSAERWGTFGMVCDVHGFSPEAVLAYEHAMALAPRDPRWPYLLAYQSFLNHADPELSARLFQVALEITPDLWPAMVRLGDVHMRVFDYERAHEQFSNAASRVPNEPAVLRRLGQAQLELGMIDEAVATLEKARSLRPDDQSARSALSKAYTAAGELDLAAQEAQAATAARASSVEFADPVRAEVVDLGVSSAIAVLRADQYIRMSEFERAIADLHIALEVRPDDAAVHARLGRAYAGLSRHDQAVAHFKRAVELEPGDSTSHVRLGSIYNDLGRPREAAYAFAAALDVDPEAGATHALLGIALTRAGNTIDALRAFERSANLLTPTDVVEFNWANAHMLAGNHAEASAHYEKSVALNPNQPDAFYNMGVAYENLGRVNEAVIAFQRAVQINPHHRAAQNLARLTNVP